MPYGIGLADVNPTPSNTAAGTSVADVGDLTGTGYDDVVIGAPNLTGASGTVYVVFGSAFQQTATAIATQNWLNVQGATQLNSTGDRLGNLNQLGQFTPTQTNPVSGGNLNFPYAGLIFTGVPSLGASVAGVTLPGNKNAILIGAPDANSGAGAAYLITGNFFTVAQTQGGTPINLTGTIPSGLNVITIANNTTTAPWTSAGQLGASVAGGSNILADGNGDIILGAPNASVAPTNTTTPVVQDTGVVYVISASALPTSTNTTPFSPATQNSSQVILFAGATSGDKAGFSVADGGNVNGATGNIDDLLIGATQAASSAGAAYLVYGGSNLAGLRTTVNGVPFISLANVNGGGGTNKVPGADIRGLWGQRDRLLGSRRWRFQRRRLRRHLDRNPVRVPDLDKHQSRRSDPALRCGDHERRLSHRRYPVGGNSGEYQRAPVDGSKRRRRGWLFRFRSRPDQRRSAHQHLDRCPRL